MPHEHITRRHFLGVAGTVAFGVAGAGLDPSSVTAQAPGSSYTAPADEAIAVTNRWAAAYDAADAEALTKLYTPDAIVLGTRSPVITQGTEAIRAYFLAGRMAGTGNKVEFGERRMIMLGDLRAVLVTGFYNFTLNVNGTMTPSPARFTMLVVKRGGDWLIAHHHSSVRP